MSDLTPDRDEYLSAAVFDYLERTEHFGHGAWTWGDAREPELILCACGEDLTLPDGVL